MLSNQELIERFVQDSIQGRASLLANASLQAITHGGLQQLIAKQSGVIASAQIAEGYLQFLVKHLPDYTQPISQALANHGFLPTDDILASNAGAKQAPFLTYKPVKLPKGYEIHCTCAMGLWKTWWSYAKRSRYQVIPMDLVIRHRYTWYPVKDIFVTDGLIYVKTLGSEIVLHFQDIVFWLQKDESPTGQQKPPASAGSTGTTA